MKTVVQVQQIKSLLKEVKSAHKFNKKQAYEWLLTVVSRNGYETGVQTENTVLGFVYKHHCKYKLKRHPKMHSSVLSFLNKETKTEYNLSLFYYRGKLVAA